MRTSLMKRSLVLLLIMVFACSMMTTGCGKKDEASADSGVFDYTIERIDTSQSQSEGGNTVTLNEYYDMITITGDSDAAARANETLKADYDRFLSSADQAHEYAFMDIGGLSESDNEYVNTCTSEVTQNENGFFSVKYFSEWYLGGVYNGNYSGVVINSETGKTATIDEVLGLEEETVKDNIVASVQDCIDKDPDMFWAKDEDPNGCGAAEVVSNMDVEDFNFYLEGDDVYLCFETYKLGPGASGSFVIPLDVNKTVQSKSDDSDKKDDDADKDKDEDKDSSNSDQVNKTDSSSSGSSTASKPSSSGSKSAVPADYIGKTYQDVTDAFGDDFELIYYEGSIGASYANYFFVLDCYNEPSADSKVRYIMAGGSSKAIGSLCGAMTYPEIVSAVGSKTSLAEPEYLYDEMDSIYVYSLGFSYNGRHVYFTWEDDPQTTKSEYITISD